jgi:hypothetical protein
VFGLRIWCWSALERCRRLESELVGERPPEPVIRGERFGLPCTPVEGEHQPAVQRFTQRVARCQRLQLADDVHVVAEREVALDPILETCQLQLVQVRRLHARERLGELGERRSASQPAEAVKGRRPGPEHGEWVAKPAVWRRYLLRKNVRVRDRNGRDGARPFRARW